MINMTAIRQTIALIEDAQGASADAHVRRVARFAAAEPELFAAVAVCLASMVDDTANVTPGALLLALNDLEIDISPALKEAHSRYYSYQSAGRTHLAPDWVRAGERLYQRNKSRRLRAAARARESAARAG